MENEKKEVKYDFDGFDAVTPALRDLLNQYPKLQDGDEISFASLGEDRGKAMFPGSGAAIEKEDEDITGAVTQVCLYPFAVVYRVSGPSEERRVAIKEWLDDLGRWLEKLRIFPTLTGGRKLLSFTRQSPAYLDTVNENQVEDWVISLSMRYQNEFER